MAEILIGGESDAAIADDQGHPLRRIQPQSDVYLAPPIGWKGVLRAIRQEFIEDEPTRAPPQPPGVQWE
jgi:hypothetical protein